MPDKHFGSFTTLHAVSQVFHQINDCTITNVVISERAIAIKRFIAIDKALLCPGWVSTPADGLQDGGGL